MTSQTHEISIFAERFSVRPEVAYVLPSVFEASAKLVKMTPRALIAEATYRNHELGAYLANVAVTVAKQDGGMK